MDAVSFVKSLELHEGPPISHRKGEYLLKTPAGTGKGEGDAFVDAGSLVSFTENLTRQNHEDVLNSTLLAQLAASKKYDRQTDSVNWYKFYIYVLMKVGWVTPDFEFSKYHSHTGSLVMSEVVLDLVMSLVRETEPTMVEATFDSFKKSGRETIELFHNNCVSGQYGNFQIVSCTADKHDQVVAKFAGAYFKARKVDYGFLFFTYNNTEIDLELAADSLTLSKERYSDVREDVIEKLGVSAKTFVEKLEI